MRAMVLVLVVAFEQWQHVQLWGCDVVFVEKKEVQDSCLFGCQRESESERVLPVNMTLPSVGPLHAEPTQELFISTFLHGKCIEAVSSDMTSVLVKISTKSKEASENKSKTKERDTEIQREKPNDRKIERDRREEKKNWKRFRVQAEGDLHYFHIKHVFFSHNHSYFISSQSWHVSLGKINPLWQAPHMRAEAGSPSHHCIMQSCVRPIIAYLTCQPPTFLRFIQNSQKIRLVCIFSQPPSLLAGVSPSVS